MLQNNDKTEAQRQGFGNYLRSLRIEAGLTCKDFAELVGFSRPTVSQYETAKIIPSNRNLDRLIAAMRDIGVEDYKIDILRQRHSASLKVSSGKVIGSVLKG